MSATLRLIFATLAGFLLGFLVGAFMFFETVDPSITPNGVLMGFVWILFSWIGGRLSYSITRDTIEKEEWEAAAQRRYDLNRLSGRMTTGNAFFKEEPATVHCDAFFKEEPATVHCDAWVYGEAVVYGGERKQN